MSHVIDKGPSTLGNSMAYNTHNKLGILLSAPKTVNFTKLY